MNSEQCRTARALLGWTAAQLVARTGVGKRTILEFEASDRKILPRTCLNLRSIFTVNGIEFINDEFGIGVKRRLKLDEYINIKNDAPAPSHTYL